jgi:hypothetical protein
VFKGEYGHVDVPADFEFENPVEEDDEEDWLASLTQRQVRLVTVRGGGWWW